MSLPVPRRLLAFLSEVMTARAGDRGEGPMNGAREPGWPFWLVWVSASVAAGVAAAIGLLSFSGLDPTATAFYLTALPLAGVLMALSQWVALRRYVAPGGMWTLATGVGWALGWPAGIFLGAALAVAVEAVTLSGSGEILAIFVGFVVAGIVPGAVTGALQWRFVLRGHRVRLGWWTLASIAGMAALGLSLWFSVMSGGSGRLVAGFAVGTALYGGITGYPLLRLLRS